MNRLAAPPPLDRRALRVLRHLLWGVAVVCLGAWGWARADAARFQAEGERRLERSLATASAEAGAELEVRALERAVEADLRRVGDGDAVAGNAVAGNAVAGDPGGAQAGAGEPQAAAAGGGSPAADRRPAAGGAQIRPAAGAESELLGRVRMPRIGLSVIVSEGIDRRTLRRAAGRIPGTAPLGGDGNTGIAGHRDGVFRDLERAVAGDVVLVDTPAGTRRYEVEAVSIVHPGATEVLAADGRPTLTLVTCYPFDRFGPAPDRWVVRARRVDPPAG